MEITSRIHSLPAQASFYTGLLAPNVYLVLDGDQGALVDSGFSDEGSLKARLEYLNALPNLRLRYIVLTHHHFDHASGAHRLRQASGAQVVLHPREEGFLRDWQAEIPQDVDVPQFLQQMRCFRQEAARARPDRWVEEGETLRVGGLTIEVIHTPGHTMGSICLYLREEKVLFTGDTVLGLGTVAVSPPPYGDMALYLQSLERLKAYDVALLLPGHGPPVKEGRRKLQELIDHRREREEQVLRLIGEGKGMVSALLAAIYPELDRLIVPMASRQIEAHLDKLVKEGRVQEAAAGHFALV
jgi:glyoxylase-like metal-dependent hydrolase (beta-lactamase superfamily II)